jgi:hypothetical protein
MLIININHSFHLLNLNFKYINKLQSIFIEYIDGMKRINLNSLIIYNHNLIFLVISSLSLYHYML